MGIGGISIWQLLIILAIVVMLFGTKKLRGFGSDLGSALKGFRTAIKDDDGDTADGADGSGSEALTAERTNADAAGASTAASTGTAATATTAEKEKVE